MVDIVEKGFKWPYGPTVFHAYIGEASMLISVSHLCVSLALIVFCFRSRF